MTNEELQTLAQNITVVNHIASEFRCSVRYDLDNKRIHFDGEIGNELALINRLEELGIIK